MIFKRAVIVVFVALAAAAVVAFGSAVLAAGIRSAESERNGHVSP